MKNILVLSGTASAINYIKSFAGDPDIRLHVTDSDPYCPGLYSPDVTPHWLPRARDTERYRAALDRILTEYAIDMLIPTSDYDIEGVVTYLHDGWAPKIAMFRPTLASLQTLSRKARLIECIAKRLPAAVPLTCDSLHAARDLPLPLVVKPEGQSGGKGVTIVHSREDLVTAVERVRALYGEQFVIQEFIPGRTYVATMVYDQKGELVIGIGMRSHLTFFTWGGGGCAGEVVDEPELIQLTDAVVAASGGWRGPINMEWRRNPATNAFYLMEANCRLNGYGYLTTMNGVCLPRVVFALLAGHPLPVVAPASECTRNFVLGYREMPVGRSWVQPAG